MANENATRTTGKPSTLIDTRVIYCGDNLEQLKKLPDACVDLIYIDPPFNSNRNYEVFWGETKEKRAFEDRHASTQAYIEFMRPRCVELARVLKKTGSFYYHCDWHASHYVKVMLDQILGENNFQNEIIWKRTTAHGDAKRAYSTVTDSIFLFSAGGEHTFKRLFLAHDPEYVSDKYRYVDERGRKYRLDNLRSPNPRPNLTYDYKGFKPHPTGWAVSLEKMQHLDANGRLEFPRKEDGRIQLSRYLEEMPGMPVSNPVDRHCTYQLLKQSKDLAYPSRKSQACFARTHSRKIALTNEKRYCPRCFLAGCGTALKSRHKIWEGRWIGIDISPTACRVSGETAAGRLQNARKMRIIGDMEKGLLFATYLERRNSCVRYRHSNLRTGQLLL